MQAAIGTQTHRLIGRVSIGHNEFFVQVFIEFILNIVGDSPLFYGLFAALILHLIKTHDVMEFNELWVLEIFFHLNIKLRYALVIEGFVC
jgi:hypothetical protein